MTEGAWIVGRVGAAVPAALKPLWRFGLTIIFFIGAILALMLDENYVTDYVRVFNFAMAGYIVLIAFQIARVNLKLRQYLAQQRGNLEIAKMLPTHIVMLAVGTILSVSLIVAVQVEFYGTPGVLGGAFPWLAALVFMVKVLGLNLVWRFVLARKQEESK